jgi:beta-aspartyl-peptidase (threonine type)
VAATLVLSSQIESVVQRSGGCPYHLWMTSIIVHGGAGEFDAETDPAPYIAGCSNAARVGHAVLLAGGRAIDAVVAAVVALEDDPLFNAGLGSALNLRGEVEMDAALMCGEDGSAGAVACLKDVKNPIALARLVMERTPHVLMAGEGLREFAIEQGVPLLAPGSLVTERARQKWIRARDKQASAGHGTVGAVARDAAGHLAAATSTGGTMLKRPGRVGDTPLIGCGTFADDARGACSCTGLGEAIIKATLARRAVDQLGEKDPVAVGVQVVADLERFGGDGGLILVDARGRLGFAFTSSRMSRAWVDAEGREGSGFGR